MIEAQLKQLGFTKNQSIIYLALFDLGKVRARDIIERTALHRNMVYLALEEFEERGLITKTMQHGVAEYSVNNPDTLVEEIEQQKNVAQSISDELKRRKKVNYREVVVSEGTDAVIRAGKKMLDMNAGETAYLLGVPNTSQSQELAKQWNIIHKKRIEKGINFKILYDRTVDTRVVDARNKLVNAEARYMPEMFKMPMWMYLYGDICYFVVAKDNPLVISMRSPDITNAFRQFFDFIWDITDQQL